MNHWMIFYNLFCGEMGLAIYGGFDNKLKMCACYLLGIEIAKIRAVDEQHKYTCIWLCLYTYNFINLYARMQYAGLLVMIWFI